MLGKTMVGEVVAAKARGFNSLAKGAGTFRPTDIKQKFKGPPAPCATCGCGGLLKMSAIGGGACVMQPCHCAGLSMIGGL